MNEVVELSLPAIRTALFQAWFSQGEDAKARDACASHRQTGFGSWAGLLQSADVGKAWRPPKDVLETEARHMTFCDEATA